MTSLYPVSCLIIELIEDLKGVLAWRNTVILHLQDWGHGRRPRSVVSGCFPHVCSRAMYDERRNKRIVEWSFLCHICLKVGLFFNVGVEALHGVSVEGRFMTSQARIDLERSIPAGGIRPKGHQNRKHDVRVRRLFGVDSVKRAPAAMGCGQKRTRGERQKPH